MSGQSALVLLWLIFLLAAAPYVRIARHPATRWFAAYLIFVTAFTATGIVLFVAFSVLMTWLGSGPFINTPLGGLVILALSFLPAFFVGRWQIRKPPRRGPPLA